MCILHKNAYIISNDTSSKVFVIMLTSLQGLYDYNSVVYYDYNDYNDDNFALKKYLHWLTWSQSLQISEWFYIDYNDYTFAIILKITSWPCL